MKNYVVGFAFSVDKTKLAMVRKNRPKWQAGKLNGIGGKIEEYDADPEGAMTREFKEETGVLILPNEWIYITSIIGPDYHMEVYTVFTDKINQCSTMEDEAIQLVDVASIPYNECIPNLDILVPMCLNPLRNLEYVLMDTTDKSMDLKYMYVSREDSNEQGTNNERV